MRIHAIAVFFVQLTILAVGSASISVVRAEEANSEARYMELELIVRELTNDGMRERAKLLSSAHYTKAADQALDGQVRLAINQAYRDYHTTPGAHLAYGTRQRRQIKAWLESHPQLNARYTRLQEEFRALGAMLNEVRGQR